MPRLEVRSITKEFPAIRALDQVSISFDAGEVHGVIGENGAGKSTLMKILGGLLQPTSGEVLVDTGNGIQKVQIRDVKDAQALGIGMIHQELNLVNELTISENVFLGRELTAFGTLNRAQMESETARLLQDVSANYPPSQKVGELSIGGKQLVEIAKVLGANSSVIIMDEPTAVLTEPESEALFRLIGKLKDKGVTVIYISHRLPEVCAICDRVTVLRDGAVVTTIAGKEANPSALAGLMVGRPLSDVYPAKTTAPDAEPVLEASNIHVTGHVRGVSFSIRPGEILGIAGLVGSGRTELAEALFGARQISSGSLRITGKQAVHAHPAQAIAAGMAYVSEDRKGLGLHLDMNLTENITLANLRAYGQARIDKGREQESTKSWVQRLDIRAGDLSAPILFLSGGNQQKVSIAKWLETNPRILFLDEPTRGIDVGAKQEMYRLIHGLAQQGLACVVISSELPEIIGLCHRAIVLREGELAGEVDGDNMTEEAIMHMAAGVVAA